MLYANPRRGEKSIFSRGILLLLPEFTRNTSPFTAGESAGRNRIKKFVAVGAKYKSRLKRSHHGPCKSERRAKFRVSLFAACQEAAKKKTREIFCPPVKTGTNAWGK